MMTFDIDVRCSECSAKLTATQARNDNEIQVDICTACLEAAEDKAREEGYNSGLDNAAEDAASASV